MAPLSTGDLVELTGLPQNTLDRWIRAGLVKPVEGGDGGGSHRRFTVAQAVAFKFVAEWRKWGAGPSLLYPTLRHLARLTEGDLLAAFGEGRTYLMKLPDGDLTTPPSADAKFLPAFEPWRFDLGRVHSEVLAAVRVIERRAVKRGRGRRRGLTA